MSESLGPFESIDASRFGIFRRISGALRVGGVLVFADYSVMTTVS